MWVERAHNKFSTHVNTHIFNTQSFHLCVLIPERMKCTSLVHNSPHTARLIFSHSLSPWPSSLTHLPPGAAVSQCCPVWDPTRTPHSKWSLLPSGRISASSNVVRVRWNKRGDGKMHPSFNSRRRNEQSNETKMITLMQWWVLTSGFTMLNDIQPIWPFSCFSYIISESEWHEDEGRRQVSLHWPLTQLHFCVLH